MSTPLSVVLLHFFGSSRREWERVAPRLAQHRTVVAFDLPGFGDAADRGAVDVAGMAGTVDAQIRDADLGRCIVVGHSMSGKVAALLASTEPDHLAGLVLVTSSPPSPEPMTAKSRRELLAFDGTRSAAERYVDGVTAERLPEPWREIAVTDAMRASPAAWKAWVVSGSQEDCTIPVGVVSLPTRIIAAASDPSLGERIQRERVLPHFARSTLAVIAGGHALPLENPDALHDEIERSRHRSTRAADGPLRFLSISSLKGRP